MYINYCSLKFRTKYIKREKNTVYCIYQYMYCKFLFCSYMITSHLNLKTYQLYNFNSVTEHIKYNPSLLTLQVHFHCLQRGQG